jgi:hypothetical protein
MLCSLLARRPRRASAGMVAVLVSACVAGTARAAELPADLDLVPRDAAGFIHIRAGDIWKAEWMTDIRRLVEKAGPEALKTYTQKYAPDLSTLERVTLVLMTPQTFDNPFPRVDPEAVSAIVIVTTNKPYDRLRVMQELGLREKLYRRHLYYFNEDLWSGLVLVDNTTFLIGSEDALVQFFDQQRNGGRDGPLQPALVEAARKHALTVALNPQRFGKEPNAKFAPPSVQTLFEARCATFALDMDKEARLMLHLDYEKDDAAKTGEKALRDTLELARMGLGMGIQELEQQLKNPNAGNVAGNMMAGAGALVGLGLLRDLDTLLKEAPIQRKDTTVQLELVYKGLQPPNTAMVLIAGMTMGVSSSQTFSKIGSAIGPHKDPHEMYFHNLTHGLDQYAEAKGTYPPPATYDKDGRPLLSWRVALLPYLGEDALYKEFHLDEPWDSLHNKRLIKRIPKAFHSPSYYGYPRLKTPTLLFTGPGTVFADKKGTRKADIGTGAILLADANSENAVYWTKPADFSVADDRPLPNLFGKYGSGSVKVLLGDGSFRSLEKKDFDEKAFRAMLKRGAKNDRPKEAVKEKEEEKKEEKK